MQREIKKIQPLLNEKGHIINPGFAKSMLWEYHKKDVKASKIKLKEWDYYLINNDDYAIAFTIADNAYIGFVSVTFLDFNSKEQDMYSKMKILPMGKFNMPESSLEGDVSYQDKDIELIYKLENDKRIIICHIPKFKGNKPLSCRIELSDIPKESMVIATPFKENKKAFYFNQKINCMKANGTIEYDNREIKFKDANGVLDWGRGVWTYDNTWYWGSASGKHQNKPFGFNIGYGFGDISKATENMIFYDGIAHKFDSLTFGIPNIEGKDDFMSKWTIKSNDDRFNMVFTPILDRADKTKVLFILSDQHQVFGYYNGYVKLDDGTKLIIKDLLGFAEKVHNKW